MKALDSAASKEITTEYAKAELSKDQSKKSYGNPKKNLGGARRRDTMQPKHRKTVRPPPNLTMMNPGMSQLTQLPPPIPDAFQFAQMPMEIGTANPPRKRRKLNSLPPLERPPSTRGLNPKRSKPKAQAKPKKKRKLTKNKR